MSNSKPKHTPGPWNGIEYNSPELDAIGFDTVRIKNHECESVCITNRANARLIAAAPDALAVINHAISECMHAYKMTSKLEVQDHPFGAALNELIMRLNEELKAVRSKATGGAE